MLRDEFVSLNPCGFGSPLENSFKCPVCRCEARVSPSSSGWPCGQGQVHCERWREKCGARSFRGSACSQQPTSSQQQLHHRDVKCLTLCVNLAGWRVPTRGLSVISGRICEVISRVSEAQLPPQVDPIHRGTGGNKKTKHRHSLCLCQGPQPALLSVPSGWPCTPGSQAWDSDYNRPLALLCPQLVDGRS